MTSDNIRWSGHLRSGGRRSWLPFGCWFASKVRGKICTSGAIGYSPRVTPCPQAEIGKNCPRMVCILAASAWISSASSAGQPGLNQYQSSVIQISQGFVIAAHLVCAVSVNNSGGIAPYEQPLLRGHGTPGFLSPLLLCQALLFCQRSLGCILDPAGLRLKHFCFSSICNGPLGVLDGFLQRGSLLLFIVRLRPLAPVT